MSGDDRSMSGEGKAITRIARKLMFKKIRSEFKNQLEDQFRADPSMSYQEFERRGNIIHNLGKTSYRDYEADRIREAVLDRTGADAPKNELGDERNRPLAEDEVDLFQWGPFIVDDEGSVKFNPLILFKKKKISDFWVHAADDERAESAGLNEPLFRNDTYKVNVKLRVNFNPFRAVKEGDVTAIITKYRLLISTDHYTEYTHRKLFTNEYELSYNTEDSEAALFFNFIVPF